MFLKEEAAAGKAPSPCQCVKRTTAEQSTGMDLYQICYRANNSSPVSFCQAEGSPLVSGEVLTKVMEFNYLWHFLTCEGRMEHKIDRPISMASAVLQSLYRSVILKK